MEVLEMITGFETENQYSRGVAIDPTFNYPRARGKYIALCEGDDCWTDDHYIPMSMKIQELPEEVGDFRRVREYRYGKIMVYQYRRA